MRRWGEEFRSPAPFVTLKIHDTRPEPFATSASWNHPPSAPFPCELFASKALGAWGEFREPATPYADDRWDFDVDALRRDGYAITEEEMTLGACSVAVPVHRSAAGGEVVAAIGVVVPTLKRHRPRLVAALQVAAQGIGRSLEELR